MLLYDYMTLYGIPHGAGWSWYGARQLEICILRSIIMPVHAKNMQWSSIFRRPGNEARTVVIMSFDQLCYGIIGCLLCS